MPTSPVFWAALDDRSLVRVVGADTRKLLNGLVTNAVDRLDSQPALFAGLLSPQGKILFDFFVVKAGVDAVFLDVAASAADALTKRLTMYKLRAAVTIEAVPTDLAVGVIWGAAARAVRVPAGIIAYADPRVAALGQRFIAPRGRLSEIPGMPADAVAYHAHRIAVGVPEGGRDYAFTEAFPHEALFDQLHGVDFEKGCYVGQEVVSRMQHRGTARNRIVQVHGAAPLQAGQPVMAGAASLGTIGSVAHQAGLALIRLDRAHEATASGQPIMADGVLLTLSQPAWATFDMTGAKKADPI
jgi:tRNA-modifying protein YgfZ